MAPSRAVLLAVLLALLLVAIAAWLLNVPGLVIAAGAMLALFALSLWLSRNAAAGKRSGVRANEPESKQH